MKEIKRYIALMLVFCLTFCCFVTLGAQDSEAASAKTAYVVTKIVVNDYDADDDEEFDTSKIVYSCSYFKNGLMKSTVLKSDNGKLKLKTSFCYNKNKIKKSKAKIYYKGQNINSDTKKTYTVNSKGMITKIKSYNEKGKLDDMMKYTWNKKGKVTSEKDYSSSGKLEEKKKYTYSSNGKIKSAKEYSANGKLEDTYKYSYKGNKQTITEYDSDGSVDSKTVVTFKNGNIMSIKKYDEDGRLENKATFTYKKIKTAKKKYVKGQQAILAGLNLL